MSNGGGARKKRMTLGGGPTHGPMSFGRSQTGPHAALTKLGGTAHTAQTRNNLRDTVGVGGSG